MGARERRGHSAGHMTKPRSALRGHAGGQEVTGLRTHRARKRKPQFHVNPVTFCSRVQPNPQADRFAVLGSFRENGVLPMRWRAAT
ncbi:hypothetical protein [Bradyrhizobium sp. DASA03120]|uniref:hypothetical protein n=1 Tax=Bradyrhizobium sp. SMVTL-02 TaxID=3395917 RepID=UPI003F719BAA